jgi:hypothetical protein
MGYSRAFYLHGVLLGEIPRALTDQLKGWIFFYERFRRTEGKGDRLEGLGQQVR